MSNALTAGFLLTTSDSSYENLFGYTSESESVAFGGLSRASATLSCVNVGGPAINTCTNLTAVPLGAWFYR